jgi:hypothetical protein
VPFNRGDDRRLPVLHPRPHRPARLRGADSVSNMQWQTDADAKAKDRQELDCQREAPLGAPENTPTSARMLGYSRPG